MDEAFEEWLASYKGQLYSKAMMTQELKEVFVVGWVSKEQQLEKQQTRFKKYPYK